MANYLLAHLHLLMPLVLRTKFRGGVLRDSKEKQSQTIFSGWKEWASELDKLHQQGSYVVDIPDNTDLAEFFKTAEYNVIYRVRSNRNIQNTCVPNTQYSFYVLEGAFIAGYSNTGDKYHCNFVNRVFTRWERVMGQINSFEALGLTDEDFSDSDFISNLALINEKIGYKLLNVFVEMSLTKYPNFSASLIAQLKKDGFNLSDAAVETGGLFKIERLSSINIIMKIEVMFESLGHDIRNKTIIAYADRDSGNMRFYGFHEMAAVQKLAEIELLNGWEPHGGEGIKIAKNGNYVSINFILMNGTTANGTTLFILPESFRPVGKDSSIPIVTFDGGGIIGYIAVSCKTGTVNLYKMAGAENVRIMCAGGFSI